MDCTASTGELKKACLTQALSSTSASNTLWHQRLGHPSFVIVHCTFSPSISLNKDHVSNVCSTCQQGKIINPPFSSTLNEITSLFELIHTNIWGSTPITSHSGHIYYINFVDDFSKFSWLNVMKNHSNVLRIFRAFRT